MRWPASRVRARLDQFSLCQGATRAPARDVGGLERGSAFAIAAIESLDDAELPVRFES